MEGIRFSRVRPGLLTKSLWVAVGVLMLVPVVSAAVPDRLAELIRRANEALDRREYSAALRAANEAYTIALGSERWDRLIVVGDAYRRIGEATGLRQSFDTKAREAYQKAFFRARQQASVEGVLRAAEGFAGLGDRQMVTHGVRVAERLAAGDPEAQAELRAFTLRYRDTTTVSEPSRH
jgi:hypothetical protein